jgi:hypothetical protein
MAFTHGKNTAFSLDNTSGSLTSIGTYVDSVEGLPGEIELADVTTFGNEGHKNIPGLESGSITVSGNWDPALDAIIGTTTQQKAATRTFEYGPAGSTASNVKYSGEAWISAYTVSSSVSEKVTFSLTLQVDGVVTRGTY